MKYAEIVMIQGVEGNTLTDRLYNVEGVLAHGATQETITEAVEYLAQWDTGDSPEYDSEEVPVAWGADDMWYEGDYILSANLGLGYISLAKKLN